jgi:hypothetical protein
MPSCPVETGASQGDLTGGRSEAGTSHRFPCSVEARYNLLALSVVAEKLYVGAMTSTIRLDE